MVMIDERDPEVFWKCVMEVLRKASYGMRYDEKSTIMKHIAYEQSRTRQLEWSNPANSP